MTSKVKNEVIRARQGMHLDQETWRKWSVFLVRLYLDSAPNKIRAQFTGSPSSTPQEAAELAEVFAMLQAKVEDRSLAAHVQYLGADLWREAVRLQKDKA
jgi:hypothetical protein